jgi:uncharacterized membrane protein
MKKLSSFNQLLTAVLFFIALLIIARVVYSGTLRYVTMAWNIFLAWIPYILSQYFMDYRTKEKWKQLFLFATWLVFFPNALYIVTDLVHLQDDTNVPWWYDTMLVFCSSFLGIMLAFVSLSKTEVYLGTFFRRRTVAALVAGILFVASFGVYLGRFHRWNSWDVLNNPIALGLEIFSKIMNPFDNYKAWAITLLFTAVYSLLYFLIKILPQSLPGNKNTG